MQGYFAQRYASDRVDDAEAWCAGAYGHVAFGRGFRRFEQRGAGDGRFTVARTAARGAFRTDAAVDRVVVVDDGTTGEGADVVLLDADHPAAEDVGLLLERTGATGWVPLRGGVDQILALVERAHANGIDADQATRQAVRRLESRVRAAERADVDGCATGEPES